MDSAHNITKIFTCLLAAFALIIVISHMQVHAEGNGEGESDNTNLSTHENEGYPSYAKTGWLVYLADTDGKLCSQVVYVSATASLPSENYDSSFLKSRIGQIGASSIFTNAEWGVPFDSDGNGRGAIIKNDLLQSTYNATNTNGAYVVKKYLGKDALNLFKTQPSTHYLILETCAYHKIFSGTAVGVYAVASSSGWAQIEKATGMSSTGDGQTGWCDNQRLQISCYLNLEWDGLPAVPNNLDRVTYDEILSYGYGMIAIRGTEIDGGSTQTTYDEDKGDTPAPPANESKGSYTIVKNYRYSEDDGANINDAGCFNINYISENITIEDEMSYRVVGWKVTDSTETKVDSLTWETSVPDTPIKKGTTSGHVTIDSGGRTLYVLLEKVTSGDGDYGTFLIESPIFILGKA